MNERKAFKFGDTCREVKLSTKDPIADGYDRYVGLEHLDSDSLKIKRWGNTAEDNPCFTRVFKKGHILFGKRRPYLRKAAVAEFDGVCSSDIIVMEGTGRHLDVRLIPALIQSPPFWDWAIKTSSGSLSPRTKFSALQEFSVTELPKEQQEKFIRISSKSSEIESLYEKALNQGTKLLEIMLGHRKRSDWKVEKLKQLIDVCIDYRGKSPPKSRGGIPLITARNIRDGWIDIEPREYVAEESYDSWMVRGIPNKNDILFTTEAPLGNVAFAPDYVFALGQRAICLRAKKSKLSQETLFWVLQSKKFRHALKAITTGTTAQGVKVKELMNMDIYYPTGKAAEAFEESLSQVAAILESLNDVKQKLPTISKAMV